MTDASWFGARLKELREAAGLTQKEMAERVGLSERGVNNYESGRRLPDWDIVLSLCNVLGVECGAFTQPPASREPARPGRPPKGKKLEREEEKAEPERKRKK